MSYVGVHGYCTIVPIQLNHLLVVQDTGKPKTIAIASCGFYNHNEQLICAVSKSLDKDCYLYCIIYMYYKYFADR